MGLNVTDLGLPNEVEERELKKHAATIHSSNTLSLLQRKISNALLYHAYKELMDKEEFEITIKQLCQLIAYQGHNHKAIREALKGLISTVIEWNVVNDVTGVEDWTASSILASVSLQGPLCFYAYSPRMKQLLHSPSMFGKINLVIQSRFKSSYGLALYENCIRYRGLPFTKWFEIDVFRKLMGVPEDKYLIFRDFKRRVLDKAVEEVNMYSDLFIETNILREKRQVSRIRFALNERARKVRIGATETLLKEKTNEEGREAVKERLIYSYGLSEEQVKWVFSQYSDKFINEKILLIESSKNYQLGKVNNLAAYLLTALKQDFKHPSATEKKHIQSKENKTSHLMQVKKVTHQIRMDYQLYKDHFIDVYLQMLSKEEKQKLINQFSTYAADPIATILRLQKYKYNHQTVLESPQIKALFKQFILEHVPTLRDKIKSIEEFVKELNEEKQKAWAEKTSLVEQSVVS